MTTASLLARAHDGEVDEHDPAARPRRRTFTAEYKARTTVAWINEPTPEALIRSA